MEIIFSLPPHILSNEEKRALLSSKNNDDHNLLLASFRVAILSPEAYEISALRDLVQLCLEQEFLSPGDKKSFFLSENDDGENLFYLMVRLVLLCPDSDRFQKCLELAKDLLFSPEVALNATEIKEALSEKGILSDPFYYHLCFHVGSLKRHLEIGRAHV